MWRDGHFVGFCSTCSLQMYPPPHHITQLTEFVLTYIYSLLALFFFIFSFTTRQTKIKTKPPSCFQQRQWSWEVWGFLWLVWLLNLRKGSDLYVQQLHWEACFIFICCHLVDPYNVIFFFLWPLAWFSLVVLEYCCFKEMSEFSSFNTVLQLSCKICLWLPVSKRLFGFGMIRLLSLYCTKIMCSWTVCKLH